MNWRNFKLALQLTKLFTDNNVSIAYADEGEGEPVVLVHGFASSGAINWITTGWADLLLDHGYRVIILDNRGHGASTKLYEDSAYTPDIMGADIVKLLNYLGVSKAHIMGYSMGARIGAFLAASHPELVHSLVMGGLGIGLVEGTGSWQPIADALLAEEVDLIIDNPRGKLFRMFADRTKSDKKALASCVISSKQEMALEETKHITMPVLIVAGDADDISGDPVALANLLPKAEALVLTGRDHMLAVGDKRYKQAVLDFYKRYPIAI